MKKPILLLNLLFSIVISIIITFKADTIIYFIITSIIFTIIIFGILTSIICLIKSVKEKKVIKSVLFGLALIILGGVFWICYIFVGSKILSSNPPYFKANIFTGTCSFGTISEDYVVNKPWYYKYDCDITDEEKTEYVRKSKYYNQVIQECNYCRDEYTDFYCEDYSSFGYVDASLCDYLISCDSGSCD